MSTGLSIRLFLTEGTPGSLTTLEIVNWTGHVISASRPDLAATLRRPECKKSGVYILSGQHPENEDIEEVYIGEADTIETRLRVHQQPERRGGKDFWDRVLIITSKDSNLTKSHVRYLESLLIEEAKKAGRSMVVNNTNPPLPSLPESDESDMKYFFNQLMVVLPILGENAFRTPNTTEAKPPISPNPTEDRLEIFELRVPRNGIRARMSFIDGEYVVKSGSLALRHQTGNYKDGYVRLRKSLEGNGTLVNVNDTLFKFSRDAAFTSPSAAAAVVTGRSTNGKLAWKVEGTETTFGEWLEERSR